MRLNQNFLYGLGSGLILAAIIFGVSDLVSSESFLPQTAAVPPAAQPAPNVHSLSTGAQPLTGQIPIQQPSDPQPAQMKETQARQEKKTVSVTIKNGMQASEIAELLKNKGVIFDVAAFLASAGEQTKNIRIGTYDLPLNGDYAEVLRIITNVQAR